MQISTIVRTSFLDGFAMAGIFTYLRRPGAPTQVFADLEAEEVDDPEEAAIEIGLPDHQQLLAYVPMGREEERLVRLRRERQQPIMDAIERLSQNERLVIELYYFDERTMKQIASVTGWLESRMAQLLARSVVHLRELLAGAASESSFSQDLDAAPAGAKKRSPSGRIYQDLLRSRK